MAMIVSLVVVNLTLWMVVITQAALMVVTH